MYIVAVGWIYVILMMAVTEKNFISGALTFVLYGALPLTVMALVFGRRRSPASDEAADREVDQRDRADSERDQ